MSMTRKQRNRRRRRWRGESVTAGSKTNKDRRKQYVPAYEPPLRSRATRSSGLWGRYEF